MTFCLEQSRDLPAARRALLYRGLAEFCGDSHDAAQLLAAAKNLEVADSISRELIETFKP